MPVKKRIGKRRVSNNQNLITVVGTNYIDLIIPDFLEKCFNTYIKKDFRKKQFQVSVYENTFATAGIVLAVLSIEAYRNRIFYLEGKKVSKNVAKDLASIFKSKEISFPEKEYEELLNEAFVLRDVIVHNHIYKVNVEYDDQWEMLGHRQKLLEGYGDGKFVNLTSSRTKKTTRLKLNIQPGKIGLEDLFLVLVMFDLFIGISKKLLKPSYVPFRFWQKINGTGTDKFYQFLTYYYNQLPNAKYIKQINIILQQLSTNYDKYVSDFTDCFVQNICFKCGEYGFIQINDIYNCKKCGYRMEFGTINS